MDIIDILEPIGYPLTYVDNAADATHAALGARCLMAHLEFEDVRDSIDDTVRIDGVPLFRPTADWECFNPHDPEDATEVALTIDSEIRAWRPYMSEANRNALVNRETDRLVRLTLWERGERIISVRSGPYLAGDEDIPF